MTTATQNTDMATGGVAKAVFGPGDATAVAAWIRQNRDLDQSGNNVCRYDFAGYIDPDANAGIDALLAHPALETSDYVIVVLSVDAMEAFASQMRFWESCMDELPAVYRADAPPYGYFQSLALESEGAADEARRPPADSPRVQLYCVSCGEPPSDADQGRAAVEISDGGIIATFRHRACSGAEPEVVAGGESARPGAPHYEKEA